MPLLHAKSNKSFQNLILILVLVFKVLPSFHHQKQNSKSMSNRMLVTFSCVLSTSDVIKITRYERKFILDQNAILLAVMIVKIIRVMNQNSAFNDGKRAKLQRTILK